MSELPPLNSYDHPLTEFNNRAILVQHLWFDHRLDRKADEHINQLRRVHETAHAELTHRRDQT